MKIYIAPVGTSCVDTAKWVDVADAIVAMTPLVEDTTRMMLDFGRTFTASYKIALTRSQYRQAMKQMTRIMRRPALLHNARKPR